jgi:hypothetical protein
MTPPLLTEFLIKLAPAERARKLTKLGHNLTICARELESTKSLSVDSATTIRKLVGFSELHHQLTAQIGHYLDGEETRLYPEAVFSQILFDVAVQYDVVPYLKSAVRNAITGSWTAP